MELDKTGKVYLIGGGPGDPGLITIRALEAISEADAVVYDRLINPSLLNWARKEAELVDVGKERGRHSWPQQKINDLLVKLASQGKTVARLKGGDPFVLGRGGEEALTLRENNLLFEIIPGVTSAVAAPAYAGIPVTHRGIAASFAVITGHEDPTKEHSSINWANLASGMDTLVFLMGMENLGFISSQLIKNGRPAGTPVALISHGTLSSQKTVVGNLGNIVETAQASGIKAPAVIVVGGVVSLREKLRWFDNKPLFGKKVLITRPRRQSVALSAALEREGAEPVEAPTIEINLNSRVIGNVINRLGDFDWLVFTSANGVAAFYEAVSEKGLDSRVLAGLKICAIGPATAHALASEGVRADLVPAEFSTEGILASLKGKRIAGKSFLLLRADLATTELEDELERRGASVKRLSVYRTVLASKVDDELKEKLAGSGIDIIMFTSASTVKGFYNLMGKDFSSLGNPVIACIGPVTAAAAKKLGLKVDVAAEEHTIDGLIAAVKEYVGKTQKSKVRISGPEHPPLP